VCVGGGGQGTATLTQDRQGKAHAGKVVETHQQVFNALVVGAAVLSTGCSKAGLSARAGYWVGTHLSQRQMSRAHNSKKYNQANLLKMCKPTTPVSKHKGAHCAAKNAGTHLSS
jgi:hypothetical protein